MRTCVTVYTCHPAPWKTFGGPWKTFGGPLRHLGVPETTLGSIKGPFLCWNSIWLLSRGTKVGLSFNSYITPTNPPPEK